MCSCLPFYFIYLFFFCEVIPNTETCFICAWIFLQCDIQLLSGKTTQLFWFSVLLEISLFKAQSSMGRLDMYFFLFLYEILKGQYLFCVL